MSDQKALINPQDLGIQDLQKFDSDDFTKVVTSGAYLPRLQLLTSNSKKCKAGEFPINHYALVKDNTFQDLGADVDLLIIAWRPKAIQIDDEEVITVFDHESEQFKSIMEKSEVADSGCLYGPEYLVWVPSKQTFALFFMGSKSARRESPNMNARLCKAGTLTSKKIETKKYTWVTPCVQDCSTEFDAPDSEELKAEIDRFNNPPKSEIEKDDSGDSAGERAR